VIQNDVGNQFSNTVIIAALTSRLTDKLYPSEVRLPEGTAGLARASAVRLDQIRTVDKRRLGRLVGRLDTHYMRQVDKAIKISLGLSD
jgi:mRNA interferase MazF